MYLRTMNTDTSTTVELLTSKSKLAPIKKQTIPRLELCGAHLLSKLLRQTAKDLGIPLDSTYAWCDSAVVLGWLKTSPGRLKTYVSHRVQDTVNRIPSSNWRYVNTLHNPADLISRGVAPGELLQNELWWKGPPWLSQSPAHWPRRPDIDRDATLPDLKPSAVLLTSPEPEEFGTWSLSYSRVCRVTSWIRRFIQRVRFKDRSTRPPYLTAKELTQAEIVMFRMSQRKFYPSVISYLQKQRSLPDKHPYSNLTPFLDKDGLLRVGERLGRSGLPENTIHPVLSSTKSYIARLLARYAHILVLHAGPSTTMAWLSKKFYIPQVKQLLKGISRRCIICQRTYAKTSSQLMADLPEVRVTPAHSFSSVGVDYAGPFVYKEGNRRKPTICKGYVAVYVCLSTKAVFFDLVCDLTTDDFLASLRRFSSIYGVPARVFSDNGSNFVGARSELVRLKKLLHSTSTQQSLQQFSFDKDCQWSFSPSRAPHFGGLWEAAVKSMKTLLLKTTGSQTLWHDELLTLLYEAASILNSRPLTSLDAQDPNGPSMLTPAHFITGRQLNQLSQLYLLAGRPPTVRAFEMY